MTALVPTKPDTLLVDLDSTLCDTRHRHHLVPTPANGLTWVDYSMGCHGDTVVEAVRRLILTLEYDHHIIILSGRDQSAYTLTESWLNFWEIPFDEIILRPDNVDIPNGHYKSREIHKLKARGFRPHLMLDDWAPVKVQVEKDHPEITVLLVQPPDNHDAMKLFSANHHVQL